MIADEVRHTEICARLAELLEPGAGVEIEETELHLPVVESSLLAHVRGTFLAAFCIGETLSGRFFRRCLRAAGVPLARDVVRAIVDDETFHGKVGWELFALLLRGDGDASLPFPVLAKPFTGEALALRIAEVIAATPVVSGSG